MSGSEELTRGPLGTSVTNTQDLEPQESKGFPSSFTFLTSCDCRRQTLIEDHTGKGLWETEPPASPSWCRDLRSVVGAAKMTKYNAARMGPRNQQEEGKRLSESQRCGMGDTRTPSGQQDWRASCSHWSGEAEAQIATVKASRVPPGL